MITWTKITDKVPEKVVNGKDHFVLAFNPGLRGPSRFSVVHARHARARPFSHWAELTVPGSEAVPVPPAQKAPPVAPKATKDFSDI